jgi:hypothetical protein
MRVLMLIIAGLGLLCPGSARVGAQQPQDDNILKPTIGKIAWQYDTAG